MFLYADSDFPLMSGQLSPASYLIANENNALPFAMDILGGGIAGFTASDVYGSATTTFTNTPSLDPTHPSSYDLRESAKDDISNHNFQSVSAMGGLGDEVWWESVVSGQWSVVEGRRRARSARTPHAGGGRRLGARRGSRSLNCSS